MIARAALALVLVAACLPISACSSGGSVRKAEATGPDQVQVVQIALPMSNAYVIKAERPILIDPGGPGDAKAIEQALAAEGIAPSQIGLIVLTHGHADHAGSAAALRMVTRAPIALGAGDAAMAAAGRNGALKPVGLEAWLIRPFVSPPFAPFPVDIAVSSEVDLKPWGVAGAIKPMPGHTEGSLVVVLDDHRAFTGDLLRGGSMGGHLNPHQPHDHYFQPDVARAHRSICDLLASGVETFYVGHGGPLTRAAVAKAFACTPASGT